ncbi:FAD-dependent oxidoreductase [Paraburkholderia dipogonis]|uniref:FAD-dependent oxidoreductase n=1 Tax=Paraburkholderia dipogonis TaxID=1211383 RepID=A0A4Y8MK11_9BURK|nr:FAD-dependent oxidoreductase [Paraburkholderia dipogonis]TFE37810.1 FAD-dependent oxidoreductase [Paraburkholderia dipogonis]
MMRLNANRFVIVGAGQSGGWAAKTLCDKNFSGEVMLIGAEEHPPYERPPLSKGLLVGRIQPSACHLWKEEQLRDAGVNVQTGRNVVAIDPTNKCISLADGGSVSYDRLLLATGARPRRLDIPGSDLDGVHYLRTIEDSLNIQRSVEKDLPVVIVGGGWIGLEVAASLHSQGAVVTVLETSDRLCGRSLPRPLGDYFFDQHIKRGVNVRLNTRIQRFDGAERVEGVVLADGTKIRASLVIVGIGVVPNSELASDAGLAVDNGILVDGRCATSDPDIFACGDVANQLFEGGRLRFESWKNAQDQGIQAAKAMLDEEVGSRDSPWFWSDQYDINFQMLGIPTLLSRVYRKGDVSQGSFADYFVEGDRLVAVAAVNCPRELREAKRAIQGLRQFDVEGLRGSAICLESH